jgi:methyl-accepting chemotaxis protein
MRLRSIQLKFACWVGLCLALASAVFISFSAYTARASALENAQQEATNRARIEAARVRSELENALSVTRTVAQTLTTLKESSEAALSREAVSAIIKKALAENPRFSAFYSDWEPHAFAGRTPADLDGRFNCIWNWDKDGQLKADITSPEDEEEADWYQVPKQTLRESIIEPYYYAQGQEALKFTLSVPIVSKGRFLGIVAADIKLDFLQKLADELSLYHRAGKLLLVSNKGVITGATDRADLINKPLQQAYPELAGDLNNIKVGKESVEFTPANLKVLLPLSVGQTGTPWAALVLIPKAVVTAAATRIVWIQIFIGLALVALVLGVLWYLTGQMAAPVRLAAQFAERIANGQSVESLPVTTQDETGRLLKAMNSMLESNSTLVQSREERDNIQHAIMRLLDEVSSVAEGDLTREAAVTPDATGAIADSFNFMITELRRIIGKVQNAAYEMRTSAGATRQTTAQLAQDARAQAEQLEHASQKLDAMVRSIQHVSATAEESEAVARQSLQTARAGTVVVQNTINSLGNLREQVQETAKRIKRLGENSQEIGEIVQLIGDIAYRTSVLALNASIQAARAGEAGRGFAVVAEEVERLSKRSTDASKRIAELVKNIQSGTNEAITAMEKSTHGVVEGTNLICAAGSALTEIESVSAHLADLIQSISGATEEQTRESAAVFRAIAEVSAATQNTATGIKQSAQTATQLATLADELHVSVASFKLSNQASRAANGYDTGRLTRLSNDRVM